MNLTDMTPRNDQSATVIIQEYVGIARRNKWLILGCVALTVALAWSYCLIATKYYRSEALIVVEEPKLVESVVQVAVEGRLEQRIEQRMFLVQRQIMSFDFLAPIAKEFDLYPEERENGDENAPVGALAGATKVERIKPDPSMVQVQSPLEAFTVSFMHPDPAIAKKVTARIAEKFIEENTREREKALEGTAEFLDDELRNLKLELEKKEEQISQFKKEHINDLPQQTEISLRALDRLEIEINSVNENLQRQFDKLAMVDHAMQEYRLYGRQNPAFRTSSAEVDPLFRRYKELREKLVKLKAEFLDEYPEVALTKEELRQVEAELVELNGSDAIRPDKTLSDPYVQDLTKLQKEAKNEVNLLKQRQQILYVTKKNHEKHVERVPVVEQELLTLERDYNNMKGNYAMLLDKRLHARVTENVEKREKAGKYRILEAANFPRVPIKPNRPRILVLGFLFGCVLGGGASVLRERLTPQFRGPEDVELLLGPQLLAAIPDFSFLWGPMRAQRYFPSPKLLSRPLGQPEGVPYGATQGAEPQWFPHNGLRIERRFVTKLFPRSMAAEQYRVAAARLQLLNASSGPTVVAVTSAVKGEGKTTSVVNLGYTLSRDFGKRVLLLDCDFVFPELKYFAESSISHGLVDCLRGDVSVDEAMVSFTDSPCWLMPAGESEADPTELLKSGQLERVLSELRGKFDYILINAPPILPVATMNVLERHTDLLLLVVRANLTSQQVVKRALGSLRASKPIHVILNAVATQALPYYMMEYSAIGERQRY